MLQNTYSGQYTSGFDPSFRLDPSSSLVPPPHSPPDSFTKRSISSNDVTNNTRVDPASVDGEENQFADPGVGRSSSEEKETMTPAQSKRKAQNRAAYVTHPTLICGLAPDRNYANEEFICGLARLTRSITGSAHSAKEKSATFAILKRRLTVSRKHQRPSKPTMSASSVS